MNLLIVRLDKMNNVFFLYMSAQLAACLNEKLSIIFSKLSCLTFFLSLTFFFGEGTLRALSFRSTIWKLRLAFWIVLRPAVNL